MSQKFVHHEGIRDPLYLHVIPSWFTLVPFVFSRSTLKLATSGQLGVAGLYILFLCVIGAKKGIPTCSNRSVTERSVKTVSMDKVKTGIGQIFRSSIHAEISFSLDYLW